jgi:LPXTG-motif cell wall-anchored protein
MKKLRKVLALILALSMCMSLLSVSVSAASASGTTTCGYHQHSDACYGPDYDNLQCEETLDLNCNAHIHGAACYHQHSDACIGNTCGESTCGVTDDPEHSCAESGCHSHSDACIGNTCGKADGEKTCTEEDHAHSEENNCYIPHEHKDRCYAEKLICTLKAHTHTSACYPQDVELGDSALISKDKYASWADQNAGIADVTLQIGGKKHSSIDVVVVMGDQMPAVKGVVSEMIELFKPILEDGDPNTNIKLGLVALGRTEFNVLDLEELSHIENDDNYYVDLIEAASADAANLPEGPTNLEGALREAYAMLAADEDVAAEDKYVYLMSTGRTYWFNDTDDANGEPVMVVHKNGSGYYWGDYQWKSVRGRHTSLYMVPDTYKNSYADFFADIEKWVQADGDKYVYRMPEGTTYTEWSAANTARKAISPAPTAENSVTGVMAGVPLAKDAYKTQHALSYERAQYEAAKAYADLQAAGYHCYAICSETPNYQNNSEYYYAVKDAADGRVENTQIQVGHAFMDYMAQMSGQEYAPLTWDYERNEDGTMKSALPVLQTGFFAPIKEHIIHALSAGSKVEDVIGYGNDYDFDFMVDGKITLTVGNTAYTTAKLDTPNDGATASYTFTAPVEGAEPTFTLDYFAGEPGDEKFIWNIDETVTIFAPATLNYQVELVQMQNNPTKAEAIVETNKKAVLTPVDSDGKTGDDEIFPVPELEIPKYKVEYVYEGDVPRGAPDEPATKYYFAGNKVYLESDEDYKVDDYIFYGWNDPCNALASGVMPAHDVTLTGYYVPVNENVDPPIGIKTDKETTGYDYEVTIAVPGDGEAVKVHEEVILIIDGSYSGDLEWDNMKANILEIGKKVLGGAGRTEMTIISFGMGDNLVAEGIKTMAELEEIMKATLPGDLLYGRSSTNCETGFNAALKYIQDKQDTLANVDVVFISDAGINTDETLRLFDDWRTLVKTANKGYIPGRNTVDFGKLSLDMACAGKTLPAIYKTLFGDMTLEQVFADDFYPNISEETLAAWLDGVYAEVYAYSGLTPNTPYPISVVERAFVKIDKEKGTALQNTFYLLQKGNSESDKYSNCAARTIDAARELAKFPLVDKLYLVHHKDGRINDYHGNSGWVANVGNCTVDGKAKAQYIKATDIANLLKDLAPMYEELSNTNYTNVVITDYMSKWVILDPTSISIVNDTTGKEIWNIVDGWAADVEKPTTAEPPVVVEEVANRYPTAEKDEQGNIIYDENQNGKIYKLTWHVKDDCLLRTDSYSLHYNVTVDVAEEGFVPGVEYPANGNTYVDYEKDGHNDIEVPNVAIPAYTVTYLDNGDVVLQKTEAHKTGDAIPGYENTAPNFIGWRLISGTEGENNTVGTTDLVYLAMYEGDNPNPPAPPAPPSGGENPPSGGGNGGGGGSTIIPEDPTPLTPAPEMEEIPEEPVPLAPAPEMEEIMDEEVPLADIPKTGDASALWLALSALSGTGLAGVSLMGRKKREEI